MTNSAKMESEERAEIEESNKKIKDNDELIKKLKKQAQDLQISRNKGLHGDERIISEAFSKHSRDIGILARKTGREAVQIIESRVLDLIKKSNALTHEIKMKEKELAKFKEQARDITWNMYNEFELERAESENLRRVREMENDYQKVEKNLMECQIIQSKYKAIQEQLRRELLAYPSLLEELEVKHSEQKEDLNKLIASEEKAHVRRDIARKELIETEAQASRARQEKERIVSEYSKALKPKQVTTEMQSVDLRESEAEECQKLRASQESELENLQKAFEKIKEAIGISDINEAETRFLSQKATKEELTQLLANTEQRLSALNDEAAELQIKNESLRGTELSTPQVVLEKNLRDAESKQEEQVKRKDMAEVELERIKTLYADIKSGLWQQLQLMEKYLKESDEEESTSPDAEAIVIVSKIEQFLERIFDRLKDQDLDELKAKLKEEEFLQKIEPPKLVPSAGAARKLKQAEEEESSDDEDFEKKRAALKEEAQVYAEMKKKQQGRGRMMML